MTEVPPDAAELWAIVDWMRDRYIVAKSEAHPKAHPSMSYSLADPEAWRIQADRLERLLTAVGVDR